MSKPKIRFKGYCNDWERRKLESLCDVFTDGDWIEAKDQSDSGIRLVQTGNVGTTEYLDKENNKKWISEETFERLHCKEIYEGDILISRLPEPAGRACIMPNLGVRMITAVDCTIVRTSNEYDSKYLVQFLSTPMYFKVVNSFLGGGTRQRISRGNLSGIDIPIPPTIDEQREIGKYFDTIDHLITLHQRQCENTKKLKKFMLQKMFPKKNQKNPEIRFAGFTNDWERRKLGDIANVTKLAGFEFTEHVVYSDEGNIIALRGLNIKNGQLILDDVKYIDGSNFSKLSRSKLFIDDIMFTYVGTVGEVAIIKENDRFYLAPNVSRIRVKSDDSPKFISHYMRTDNFKNKVIFPLIATSSQPALSMENIRKFTINIPISREEQDCLAKYFDSLDHLITLHQNKCDELKKLKKFMLQNMFI